MLLIPKKKKHLNTAYVLQRIESMLRPSIIQRIEVVSVVFLFADN